MSSATALAALAAAAAVALAVPAPARELLARRVLRPGATGRRTGAGRRTAAGRGGAAAGVEATVGASRGPAAGWRNSPAARAAALVLAPGALGSWWLSSLVPLLVAVFVAVVAVRVREGARRRRVEATRRALTVEAALALVAALRAGRTVEEALTEAATAAPDLLGEAAANARLGGDVPAALRSAAAVPGAEALAALALGWQVGADTGAPLADTVTRVVDSVRAADAVRQEAAIELGSVRATARLLAALPAVTVLLGTGMGGRPLTVLTGTGYGVACLIGGGMLAAAGLVWVDRLARSVEGTAWTPQ